MSAVLGYRGCTVLLCYLTCCYKFGPSFPWYTGRTLVVSLAFSNHVYRYLVLLYLYIGNPLYPDPPGMRKGGYHSIFVELPRPSKVRPQ